ncbi:hypothetical protein F0562_029357 [Nyssa sinensis]|uniref:Uncharacterized GPI-anchored protein At5g19230-like domain-containing protein n=1 Tax=Nyssa sinensis TaxID=561372 RepID=A0A5J5B2H9_9ASTE|nr:hypothetical protein F0562_029357 [Nyssa sinensis]
MEDEDEEDHILQGINSYRTSLNLPALAKNDKAGCLADEIADKLEDEPCPRPVGASALAGTEAQAADYPDILKKCKIDINSTRDGVILPVCVPKRVSTLVLTNYTQSPYARYVNNSKYTGAGIGTEDDWTVLVLATNTPGGSFVSAAGLVWMVGMGHFLLSLLLGLCLVLVNY